jgi:hypothetical protein
MDHFKVSLKKDGQVKVKLSRNFPKKPTKKEAIALAKELYYEILFVRHLPEIKAIKKGEIKAKSGDDLMRFLEEQARRD